MAAGDKVILSNDQILADLRTDVQIMDGVVDEIRTDIGLVLTSLASFCFDGDALLGVDGPHHYIHKGWAFSVHLARLSFAKDGETGILFTCPVGDKEIHVVPLVSVTDKSTFRILQDPTLDTGNYPVTFYAPRNRNQNSSIESIVSSVRAAPAVNSVSLLIDGNTTPISADGFVLHEEVIGGAKNKSAGEGIRDVSEYVLLAGATYYFQVVGDGTGTGGLGMSMELSWYERDSIL